MRTIFGVILSITLVGCSVFAPPPPEVGRSDTVVVLEVTEDLPDFVFGTARYSDGLCFIKVRKSTFPYCLSHEVLHCLGWNHTETPNTEYCRVE